METRMNRLFKLLLIVAASVLVCVVVVLVALSITGFEPRERRAGFWLKGELATGPVADWSFTDKHPTIFVQTRTWYLVPHSVTTTCVAHNGQLYLTSVYPAGAQFPRDRLWNRNVVRDPRVRLKIGNQVFDRTLAVVTDPAERDAALQSKKKKYPRQRVADTSTVYVFRVQPG